MVLKVEEDLEWVSFSLVSRVKVNESGEKERE